VSWRALVALATAAAVALAALVVTRGRDSSAVEELLLPGLVERLEGLTGLEAVRGDGVLIARLERREPAWVVANRGGYPADTDTVSTLLDQLVAARRIAPKADDPDGHARLGVAAVGEADARSVAVTLEGVDDGLTLILGEAVAGDVDGRYVRRAGADRAWHVRPAIDRPDRISDWLDERLIDIAPEAIARVVINAVDGEPVRVQRSDGDDGALRLQHPPGREPLSSTTAESIARVLTDLRLTDVTPAQRAPDWPHRATAAFEMRSGLRVRLTTFAPGRSDERHFVRLQARAGAHAGPAVEQRAQRLNGRWSGWVYTLPAFKRTNATRTLEGVLE